MQIEVYGADWCPMTQDTLQHLRELGVEYRYIDIEGDERARQWVKEQNGGREKKPTVKIDEVVLTEPSNEELDDALNGAPE